MGKSEKNTNINKEASTSTDKNNLKYQENSYMNQPLINMRYDYDIENSNMTKSIPVIPKVNAPFGSTSIKQTLNNVVISDNPGPGSYDIELKNLLSNLENPSKFFITGDSRFKTSDNHIPGVGEYDLSNNSLNNNINANKNINQKKILSSYRRITLHEFKSPRRVPTIPDKDSKFGFGEDKEGKMELLVDPNIDQKFDGTRNNSIGPDRYNAFVLKHNNAINWDRASKKILDGKNKNSKTEEFYNNENYDSYNYNRNLTSNSSKNNFEILTEFYNFANKTDDENNLKNKKNKNQIITKSTKYKIFNNKKLYKNEYLGLKDPNYDTSYIDLTSVPLKKREKEITPGPGAYDPASGNFSAEPKKNKYQNFGTYQSRNMFPFQRMKDYKNYLDNSIDIDKFSKKQLKTIDDKYRLNEYARSLHNFRINLLKEQSKRLKDEISNKLGPGTYSPDTYYNIGDKMNNNTDNSNSLEKQGERKPIYITVNENPGVGEYDISGQLKKEIDYILLLKKSKEIKAINDQKFKMENIRRRIRKRKEKENIVIRKEYKDTKEYKRRQEFLYNYYRPGFNSAEPKFKDFSKDDTNIGVGSYNLIYPPKINQQIKVPFLIGSKKFSDKSYEKKDKLSGNLGPGTYEHRSFFDWNKKSFNVQYKFK